MRKLLGWTAGLIALVSCTQPVNRYHTNSGLVYSFAEQGRDSIIRVGQTAKIQFTQRVGDHLISSTSDSISLYYLVMPGTGNAYNPLEVFNYGVRKGDSIVVYQRVDSMLKKKIFTKMPPWMKKSDEWVTTMRIQDVFLNDSSVQADKQWETQRYVVRQRVKLEDSIRRYLDMHQLTADKLDTGLFAVLVHPGAGGVLDSTGTHPFQFELRLLGGKKLASTLDTSFHLKGPVSFKIGDGHFPANIERYLVTQREGAELRLYMPAVQLFGLQSRPDVNSRDCLELWMQFPQPSR